MNLNKIFNDEKFYVISDNNDFLNYCNTTHHLECLNINDIIDIPKNSIAFAFSEDAHNKISSIIYEKKEIKHIFLAMNVFNSNLDHAIYNIDLILKSDLYTCIKKQENISKLIKINNNFTYNNNGINFEVKYNTPENLIFIENFNKESSFILSIADFFEVYFAHPKPEAQCPFIFNGNIIIDGIIASLRPNAHLDFKDMKPEVNELIKQVSTSKKTEVIVNNNEIISFLINDIENINLLKKLPGKRELFLTEFAIGLNKEISTHVDFSYNSQVNEGISGVHIGIGDAVNGYHIDFIAPGIKLL